MGSWFAKLFKKKEYNILIIGLQNSGKSTIVQRLLKKDDPMEPTIPTIGSQVKEYSFQKLKFVLWDVGGQKDLRNTWKHYFVGTHAIIYVVDSADTEKLTESVNEFEKVINDQHVSGIPCLILGNKSDLPNSLNEVDLTQHFNIAKYGKEYHCSFRLQRCSALTGDGLNDGFTWISEVLST